MYRWNVDIASVKNLGPRNPAPWVGAVFAPGEVFPDTYYKAKFGSFVV